MVRRVVEGGGESRVHLDEKVTTFTQLLIALGDNLFDEAQERLIYNRGPDVDDPVTGKLLDLPSLRGHVIVHVGEFLEEI